MIEDGSDYYLTVKDGLSAMHFCGPTRCSDEIGRGLFAIHVSGFSKMYGEWREKWAENGADFDVEVVSFGFHYLVNVGSPHPNARRCFSAEEGAEIERLARILFENREARYQACNHEERGASRFLGQISFLPNWICSLRCLSELS